MVVTTNRPVARFNKNDLLSRPKRSLNLLYPVTKSRRTLTAPTASELTKNTITEAVRIRRDTDEIMSALWILSPLLGFVAFFIILFGGLLLGGTSGSGLGLLAGGILGFVAATIVAIILFVLPSYKLMRRRNEHFRRDRMLREGLVNYVRGLAAERGLEAKMNVELATMITIHSEANGEEDEKSPVLWIVLSIITFGLLGLYVWYFLTKDPHKHDVRQVAFMQQVQSAFSKFDKTVVFPFWKTLPSRSFFLYLVLTWLTGLFGLYWNYVLISDFNDHFRAQWQVEDQLLANL